MIDDTIETTTFEPIDPRFKVQWIEALRSGKYKQCQGRLTKDGNYCCLGVAAEVGGYIIDEEADAILSPGGIRWGYATYAALGGFGLKPPARDRLISMNDGGKTFAEIADFIERRL
jgi:hypothetical protein